MAAPTASLARRALRQFGSPERARFVARFFRTGKGEYGEGDVFMGASVPECRIVAREFRELSLGEVEKLLVSRVHEERLVALIIMVERFRKEPDAVFRLYRRRMAYVNNWDLVDASAPAIVGGWLEDQPRELLDRLARSKNLWLRRIAMVATFQFIRQGESKDAIRIAGLLVGDSHDLIHKAVGWMLREVGKRVSEEPLNRFLRKHASTMPRTMLRYAIERLSPGEKEHWMKKPSIAGRLRKEIKETSEPYGD